MVIPSFYQVSTEYEGARTEVQSLSGKVRNLEQVLEEMRKAAESRQASASPKPSHYPTKEHNLT